MDACCLTLAQPSARGACLLDFGGASGMLGVVIPAPNATWLDITRLGDLVDLIFLGGKVDFSLELGCGLP